MEHNQQHSGYYLKVKGERVDVTEAVYRAQTRADGRERKQKEREKRCRAERGNRCTKNCSKCLLDRTGTPVSLEVMVKNGYEIAAPHADPAEMVELGMRDEMLRSAIGKLEPLSAQIMRMLFFKRMTERQVADAVGLSQKGVNKRKAKALTQLGVLMKEWR